jgi:hypothetical protein
MFTPRSRIPTVLALLVGVFMGWALASLPRASLHASAGDRSGESVLATGPVLVRYDEGTKSPIPLDALYFLDYKCGRLVATIPAFRQTTSSTRLIDTFVERDLVSDFKLDLDVGPRPHFLMTTGSLGPFSSGWAPLYVFETTTSQVAIYRVQLQQSGGLGAKPRFDLVELRSFAKAGTAEQRP